MRLRKVITWITSPFPWTPHSGLRLRSKGSASKKKTSRRTLASVVYGDNFRIAFRRVSQGRGVYFVPKFAAKRPASLAIAAGNVYEPKTHRLIDEILQRRAGDIVHAGTFFGDMLPTFARSCPGTVYAFEPVLENYVLAKLCVEENGLRNVYLQNAGLSDSICVGHIDTGSDAEDHRGGASALSDAGQSVGLLTIDCLDLRDLAIVQLDVEGHELSALRGARSTIERNQPIVLIEDMARNCHTFLEEMGYANVQKVPGLFVWAQPADKALVTDVFSQAQLAS